MLSGWSKELLISHRQPPRVASSIAVVAMPYDHSPHGSAAPIDCSSMKTMKTVTATTSACNARRTFKPRVIQGLRAREIQLITGTTSSTHATPRLVHHGIQPEPERFGGPGRGLE